VGGFARFLEAISFSHGAVLNTAAVARDCAVGRKTVENYIEILEDLLLSWRLPVFTRRARRHLISHPKFYFFDTGVYRSLRPTGPLDSPAEIGGAGLEGLVAQHLRAWQAYGHCAVSLGYWRTKSGNEVDFVVYGENTFAAIEVKNATRPKAADLGGLKAFHVDYPEARLLLLYRGTERLLIDGVLCLPCEDFLADPGTHLNG
jgi:predicted AAA+ superfamily ATPase